MSPEAHLDVDSDEWFAHVVDTGDDHSALPVGRSLARVDVGELDRRLRSVTTTEERDDVLAVLEEAITLADGYHASDVGNAARLVDAADGTIRHVLAWGKWLVWQDGRHVVDSSEALITEKAKQVADRLLRLAAGLGKGIEREQAWKLALRCETASAIGSRLRLARGIPGIAVDHQHLDADPWALNVLNGTIDLRTGQLRPHDPAD